jgi:hypothetical protein
MVPEKKLAHGRSTGGGPRETWNSANEAPAAAERRARCAGGGGGGSAGDAVPLPPYRARHARAPLPRTALRPTAHNVLGSLCLCGQIHMSLRVTSDPTRGIVDADVQREAPRAPLKR